MLVSRGEEHAASARGPARRARPCAGRRGRARLGGRPARRGAGPAATPGSHGRRRSRASLAAQDDAAARDRPGAGRPRGLPARRAGAARRHGRRARATRSSTASRARSAAPSSTRVPATAQGGTVDADALARLESAAEQPRVRAARRRRTPSSPRRPRSTVSPRPQALTDPTARSARSPTELAALDALAGRPAASSPARVADLERRPRPTPRACSPSVPSISPYEARAAALAAAREAGARARRAGPRRPRRRRRATRRPARGGRARSTAPPTSVGELHAAAIAVTSARCRSRPMRSATPASPTRRAPWRRWRTDVERAAARASRSTGRPGRSTPPRWPTPTWLGAELEPPDPAPAEPRLLEAAGAATTTARAAAEAPAHPGARRPRLPRPAGAGRAGDRRGAGARPAR